MVKGCSICGEEDINLKWSKMGKRNKLYCSFRCFAKDNRKGSMAGAIILTIMTIALVILTFNTISTLGGGLFIMYLFLSIGFIIFDIIAFRWAISGFIYYKEDQKKNDAKLKSKPTLQKVNDIKIDSTKKPENVLCYHCGTINDIEDSDSYFCNSCGKKNTRCMICNNFIEHKEKISQLEPCGHIFHREHITEWVSDQDFCPICFQKIEEVDLNLEGSSKN